ncbi:TAXI family TRAP transporter solute-binding subunit [Salibacterium aidingense]|uniref:TAXI family TRAP transporter solute-binding subunit n=1 Tax=Salibacterium aidingense TaxID=384933 RepID=UPI0003FCFEA9|nr:TAXI family TRAP transporter solute-binding subunit [Salibacterium aidingense]
MRKPWNYVIFLFITAVLMLAACGEGEEGTTGEENTGGQEEGSAAEEDFSDLNVDLTMGEQSGSMYPIGASIGEFIGNEFEGAQTSVEVGGALANLELVGSNEAQMGHSSSGLSYAATEGMEPYDQALPDVRSIAKVFESVMQFAVRENVEVDSLKEVKEQQYPLKLSVGTRGTENELLTRRILEEYGITYEEIEDWGGRIEYVSMGDASSLMRDGHIEAVTSLAGFPSAPFEEMNASRKLKFFDLEEEVRDNLAEKYGYQKMELPAETYNGQGEAAETVGGGVVIIANKDMPEEVIYEVTKWMNSEEGNNTLGNINSGVNEFLSDPEKASDGLGAPLHPGAERYYEEEGVEN